MLNVGFYYRLYVWDYKWHEAYKCNHILEKIPTHRQNIPTLIYE